MELPILDLIFLGFVILFALWGAKRGLVLSLCSLIALVVAVIGAGMVVDALAPALAQQVAPMVEGFISDNLDAILAGQAGEQSGFLWGFIRQAIAGSELAAEAAADFAAQLAVQVSTMILRPVLFALAFALILVVWFFISHALDLVSKLPVLNFLNHVGGFLFGAVKGALLALVILWLVQAFRPELIPAAWLENSALLGTLETVPFRPVF